MLGRELQVQSKLACTPATEKVGNYFPANPWSIVCRTNIARWSILGIAARQKQDLHQCSGASFVRTPKCELVVTPGMLWLIAGWWELGQSYWNKVNSWSTEVRGILWLTSTSQHFIDVWQLRSGKCNFKAHLICLQSQKLLPVPSCRPATSKDRMNIPIKLWG